MSSLVVHIYVKEVLVPFSFHLDFMSCLIKIQPTSLVNVFTSGAVASSRSGQKCADEPRFQSETEIASRKGRTPSQLALARAHRQRDMSIQFREPPRNRTLKVISRLYLLS